MLRKWNSSLAGVLLLLSIFISGCTGSIPSSPDSPDNLSSHSPSDKLIGQMTIGPEGGSFDIGWFYLDFPEGSLTENAKIEISKSILKFPREGTLIAGFPIKIEITPLSGNSQSPIAQDVGYRAAFRLNYLPENDGDFTEANKYIDISSEYIRSDGTIGKGNAWAKRRDDELSKLLVNDRLTIALIDFKEIPEMNAEPVFTDDPRTLTGLYSRYADIEFNPDNLGPLGERMPVLLIHGLQLDNLNDEPFDLSETEAIHGELGWINFINAINGVPNIFDDFKFFWYSYPSGTTIFGDDGIAAQLRIKLDEWFLQNESAALVFRPMIIVCHSMGGLVSRTFTQYYAKGLTVPRILSVATPHYGSPLVNVGADLADLPFFGWLNSFLTDGVLDLACDETIKYTFFGFNLTAELDENLGLRQLNQDFPEDDPRLIVYGASSTTEPNPGLSDEQYLTFTILDMVTSPGWLKESFNGWHSDTVVNWTSQYYTKTGTPPLDYNSNSWHLEVMSDPTIHSRLFAKIYEIKDEYE